MSKFIDTIKTNIPYRNEAITINLGGHNLIITGANGSGKTSLVTEIYKKLNDIIRNKKGDKLLSLQGNRRHWLNQLQINHEGTSQYQTAKQQLDSVDEQLRRINGDPHISILNQLEFSKNVDAGLAVIELFPAVRQSAIQDARSASGTNYNKQDLKNVSFGAQIGNQLEQHLVNLYTRRSFSITENNNPSLESAISDWLSRFEINLKFLMEDNSTKLKFDAENFKFYINQDGKLPYTFQNLSSGYSSIFSVFSTLLMRAEYLKVSPLNLCGVAIIDEIDAHLHVTLQRKILPFLAESFPGIQFISTTHSPFVLTSVSDSIIFDITKNEQAGDLSSYSYESVLEGLFGVPPSSNILQEKIRVLAGSIGMEGANSLQLTSLMSEIDGNSKFLDEESKFFLNKAKFFLSKKED